jgi:hypothetical protein
MMFLDCPAYLDQDGAVRCGLPAEVRCRFTMHSTDGLIESAMIRCPAGHHFTGAIESLTWDGNRNPGTAGLEYSAGSDSLRHGHAGRDGGGGPDLRDFPAEPERKVRRPNTAPFYYLGRPAAVWITAMRPRRRPTATGHPMKPPSAAATTALGPRHASAQLTSPVRPGGIPKEEVAPWVSG